jgi:hypothetical protein
LDGFIIENKKILHRICNLLGTASLIWALTY